jgi:hypothetical protein
MAMIGAGLACLLHAFLPFLFVRTGSEAIARLHQRMVVSRTRHAAIRVTSTQVNTASE